MRALSHRPQRSPIRVESIYSNTRQVNSRTDMVNSRWVKVTCVNMNILEYGLFFLNCTRMYSHIAANQIPSHINGSFSYSPFTPICNLKWSILQFYAKIRHETDFHRFSTLLFLIGNKYAQSGLPNSNHHCLPSLYWNDHHEKMFQLDIYWPIKSKFQIFFTPNLVFNIHKYYTICLRTL